jgi:hypothetical protein
MDLVLYQQNQKYHVQFNEASNFLLQITDCDSKGLIEEKQTLINKRWKSIQQKYKNTEYEQLFKYIECEQSLHTIHERLNRIELLTQKQCKFQVLSVNKFLDEIQKAFKDCQCLDTNLKLLVKLANKLNISKVKNLKYIEKIKELNGQGIDLANSRCDNFKKRLPVILTNLKNAINEVTAIEDGLTKLDVWLNSADKVMSKICVSVESDIDQFSSFDQFKKKLIFIQFS